MAKKRRKLNQLQVCQAILRRNRQKLIDNMHPSRCVYDAGCRPFKPEEVGVYENCLEWLKRECRGKSVRTKIRRMRQVIGGLNLQ